MGECAECPTCGAKMVEYTFQFNKGLRSCLEKLAAAGDGPVKIRNLGLTTSEWTNFAKLRYWKLAERCDDLKHEDRKGGVWRITATGCAVVDGKARVMRKAVMRQNRLVRYEGPTVGIDGDLKGYEYRKDYQEQAQEQISAAPGQMAFV